MIIDWLKLGYTDIFSRCDIDISRCGPSASGRTCNTTILGAIAIMICDFNDVSLVPVLEKFVQYMIKNADLYGGPASVITYLVKSQAMNALFYLPANNGVRKQVKKWAPLWRQGKLD